MSRSTPLRRRRRAPFLPVAVLSVAFGILVATAAGSSAAADLCPESNPPNTLIVAAGSPQTAQLETPFASNLQVALANTNGCPLTGRLAGVAVEFNAPADAASGTFAGSGTSRVVVGTDASGVATAPAFTANNVAGGYSVNAASQYGSVRLALTNTASGVPASITAVGQIEQSANVNGQYGQPLQARVLDADGLPVRGATVAFSLGTGPSGAGASFLGGGAQATATTRSDGLATSPPVVANATPGRFTGTASVSGIAAVATFALANHVTATTITAGSGAAQTATVGTRYRKPLTARVVDASGRPVEGSSVTFTLTAAATGAGASFVGGESQETRLTDANGVAASPALLAGTTAGRFSATATTANANAATYRLRNLAGPPSAISAGAASGQSTTTGSRFPIRLAVRVTDSNGNPVAGAVVTFTAPNHGPSGRFAGHPRLRAHPTGGRRSVHVKTDSNGVAIAPVFVANRKPGGYVVTARAAGSHKQAAIALVNGARR